MEWIGKEKVVNHADEVSFHVLERSYSYGAEDSQNKIIHGDNLVALKSLLPEYEGRVKCIYIANLSAIKDSNWSHHTSRCCCCQFQIRIAC